ncbi:MAG: glycoside hydrolase family 95 protein, partial [Acetatifactor sp.]|nr:glycoside hydrolase family 95 protein [Acetatifactor sp.]
GLQRLLREKLARRLDLAQNQEYEKLLAAHVADYRELYGRVSLEIDWDQQAEQLPTDRRVELAAQQSNEGSKDLGLAKLYFDYGRYLLIACSRPGGLPATLQGLWNKDMTPPWES